MTGRLRDCGIFFGEWPETIAFATILVPAGAETLAHGELTRLKNLFESYIASSDAGLKLWPALGGASFSPVARPRRLTQLHFNGDTSDVIDFTERIAFGAFVAGAFGEVVASMRVLKRLVDTTATDIVVEIGSRFAEGRGHGGFIDGVSNLQELPSNHFASCVFVGPEEQRFENGSYAVIRKYEEEVELWTDLPDSVQEQILGRDKLSGDLLARRR